MLYPILRLQQRDATVHAQACEGTKDTSFVVYLKLAGALPATHHDQTVPKSTVSITAVCKVVKKTLRQLAKAVALSFFSS